MNPTINVTSAAAAIMAAPAQASGTAPSPEVPQLEAITVDTVEAMMTLLGRWHRNKLARLSHLQLVPDGEEVEITDKETGLTRTLKLTGDARDAFKLGVQFAKAEIAQLPFVAELEDTGEAAGEAAPAAPAAGDEPAQG